MAVNARSLKVRVDMSQPKRAKGDMKGVERAMMQMAGSATSASKKSAHAMDKMSAEIKGMSLVAKRESTKVAASMSKMERAFSRTFGRMTTLVGGFAAFYAAQRFTTSILRDTSLLQQMTVTFETLLRSSNKANRAVKDIKQLALETPGTMQSMLRPYAGLLQVGVGQDSIMDRLEQFSDIAAGTSAIVPFKEGMVRLTKVFQRMKGGHVDWQDIENIETMGLSVTNLVKQIHGVSRHGMQEKMRTMGAEEFMKPIFDKFGEQFDGLAEKMMDSLMGSKARLQQAFFDMNTIIGEGMEAPVRRAAASIEDLVRNNPDKLRDLGEALGGIAESFGTMIGFFADNPKAVGLLFQGMGTVLAGFAVTQVVSGARALTGVFASIGTLVGAPAAALASLAAILAYAGGKTVQSGVKVAQGAGQRVPQGKGPGLGSSDLSHNSSQGARAVLDYTRAILQGWSPETGPNRLGRGNREFTTTGSAGFLSKQEMKAIHYEAFSDVAQAVYMSPMDRRVNASRGFSNQRRWGSPMAAGNNAFGRTGAMGSADRMIRDANDRYGFQTGGPWGFPHRRRADSTDMFLSQVDQYESDPFMQAMRRRPAKQREEEMVAEYGDSMKAATDRIFKDIEEEVKESGATLGVVVKTMFISTFQELGSEGMRRELLQPLKNIMTTFLSELMGDANQDAGKSIGRSAARGVRSFLGFEGGGWTGNSPRSGGLDGRGMFMGGLHGGEVVFDTKRRTPKVLVEGGGAQVSLKIKNMVPGVAFRAPQGLTPDERGDIILEATERAKGEISDEIANGGPVRDSFTNAFIMNEQRVGGVG